jgi:hypothetical protein
MKNWLKNIMTVAVVLTWMATVAPARADLTCHKINATGEGYFTGPTSTVSQIIGGGICHGTTSAELTITGIDPITGVLTYDGTLVLTAEHGTLTLYIFNGVYNPVTGEFSNDSVAVAGTD